MPVLTDEDKVQLRCDVMNLICEKTGYKGDISIIETACNVFGLVEDLINKVTEIVGMEEVEPKLRRSCE
jgi:hypothetical protein